MIGSLESDLLKYMYYYLNDVQIFCQYLILMHNGVHGRTENAQGSCRNR